MSNLLAKIEESKRRTHLWHGISVDWQYANQLIPLVLNANTDKSPNCREEAKALALVLTNIEEAARELRERIPRELIENVN